MRNWQMLRNEQQSNRIGAINEEESKLKLDQEKAAVRSQRAVEKAYTEAGGNIEKAIPIAMKYGASPEHLTALQKAAADQQKQNIDLLNTKGARALQEADIMQGAHDQVAAAPPEMRPQVYQQTLQNLQQYGIDISTVPPEYPGDQAFKIMGVGLAGHKQQLAELEAQQKRELEVAKALEDARHHKADEQNTVRGQDITKRGQDMVDRRAQQTNAINANKRSDAQEAIHVAAMQLVDPRNLTALKDIASLRGDQRLMIFQEAKKLNPSFDPGLTNRRIRFIDAYEDPKGRSAINRQAINNILQHGADLLDLNNQYRRSDVRVLNTPINGMERQFGNGIYTQFATVNSVLKDELSLYFAGGYAPTPDQQKMWNKIQSDEATPAQTEAFAREVGKLGFRRANTFNSQFKGMMGYDDPNMLSPEAANAAEKLGLGEQARKFGIGGQLGQAAQQQPNGEGATATGPNGHQIVVKNGRWVDAQTGQAVQ